MRNMGGRHELKYYINDADFIELRSRLPYVLKRDKNAIDGSAYRVRSLYFDNYNDKALCEKINGVNEREKFRLRFYNDNPSFIRLEKKSKNNGMCFKRSEVIAFDQCSKLISGQYEVLKENGKPLLLELYTKLHSQLLRPKNIVDYKREAFVFNAGNVRVTLDHDIRASYDIKNFLHPEIITIPIPGTIILEVKYDHFLPELIRGLVTLSSRQQTAFSKYATARII
jgi:hypothetical protein